MLIRILAPDSFGAWTLFVSMGTLLEVTRNGLFKNPLIRFLNTHTDTQELYELQNASIVLNALFSISTSLLLYAASFYLAEYWNIEGFDKLFLWYIVCNLFLPFFFHFEYVLKANFDFQAPFVGYFLRSGSIFLVLAYFFWSEKSIDLELLSIVYTLSVALGALSNFLFGRKYVQLSLTRWSSHKAKQLLSYGKYTLVTNIAATLSKNIDAWMIAYFLSPASVALYNVAVRVSNLFDVPTMALASIMFPKAAKQSAEEGESVLKEMYEKSVAAILLFTIPMVGGVLLFSDFIIYIIAGEGYEKSASVLRISILFGLILPFGRQMGLLLDAIGRAKLNTLFVILSAVLNVIANAIAIPRWGIIGAAIATMSVFFVTTLIGFLFLYRKYHVSPLEIVKYMRLFALQVPKKVLKLNR